MQRRFQRGPSRWWLIAAAFATLVVARIACGLVSTRDRGAPNQPLREGACEFVRVVDPITIVVRQSLSEAHGNSSRDVTVRLLGVASPFDEGRSDRQLAESAVLFVQQFLTDNPVRLQLDKRQLDPDQRFLAYVLAGDQMLNEELVRAGWARVDTRPGDSQSITRRLRAAEGEARRRGRGFWATQPVDGETPPPELSPPDEP